MRCLMILLPGVHALALVSGAQTTAGLLSELGSGDPARRMEAFYRIVRLGEPAGASVSVQAAVAPLVAKLPEMRAALIEALKRENALLRQPLELGDDYSNYYGDLLAVVAAVGDPRAIPALADAMGTGNLAMGALVAFGRPALEAVLERLKQGRTQRSACAVLGRMLDPNNPQRITDPHERKRVEDSLLGASGNSRPLVSISAFEALTRSESRELRETAVKGLEELAGGEGSPSQEAAFHSLRWLAEGDGSGAARTLAINALGAIARRPGGSFQQLAAATLQQLAQAPDGEAGKAAREALRGLSLTNRLERLLEGRTPP